MFNIRTYNKISENSFKIQCDYKHTEENNLEYLIPVVVEKPEILFDIKIVPNKIEFLIKKWYFQVDTTKQTWII